MTGQILQSFAHGTALRIISNIIQGSPIEHDYAGYLSVPNPTIESCSPARHKFALVDIQAQPGVNCSGMKSMCCHCIALRLSLSLTYSAAAKAWNVSTSVIRPENMEARFGAPLLIPEKDERRREPMAPPCTASAPSCCLLTRILVLCAAILASSLVPREAATIANQTPQSGGAHAKQEASVLATFGKMLSCQWEALN